MNKSLPLFRDTLVPKPLIQQTENTSRLLFMPINNYSQYQQNQLATASPAKLLLAAYDGAIRFCRIAKQKMAEKQYCDQNTNINKALAIICELLSTLREDANPSLVARLRSIYLYMIEQLAHANLKRDESALDEVIHHLEGLRETWAEADRIIQREIAREEAA
jgi:flagellar secretion chaperone FliS